MKQLLSVFFMASIVAVAFSANAQVQITPSNSRNTEIIGGTPKIGKDYDKYKGIVEKKDGTVHISEVVTVDGVEKSDLYTNCISWIAENFENPKDVIQVENESAGIVSIQHVIDFSKYEQWDYKMTIQVKDGRYKYDITDIYVRYPFPASHEKDGPIEAQPGKDGRDWREKIYPKFEKLIESMKKRMKVESDW